MSVSGNVLKKIRVGRSKKISYFIFSFYGVKRKIVVLICQIVILKVDYSSYYA